MPERPSLATVPAARPDAPAPPPPGEAAARRPGLPDVTNTRGLYVAERVAWSVLWLGVLAGGVSASGFWWSSATAAGLAPLMIMFALAGLLATWLVSTPHRLWLQIGALVGVELAIAIPQVIAIHTRVFYSTDSAAFDQVSALALLHGHNPYTTSLESAARLFSVPSRYWTYTVGGGHVASASYPAGSFLLQVPAAALGVHHMVVDWTDLVCWMACVALFFFLLPRSLRWLAGLLAMTSFLLVTFSNGNTDAMFLPALLVAVWRWDRYGDPAERGLARWIGPVALGLACTIKQTPWFFLPFLTLGVALEASRAGRPALRRAARYLGTAVGVFAAVNLPFAALNLHAWVHAVLLPFTGGLVAGGQGLVTLATHGVTGGVELEGLSVAAALAMVGALAALALWYPALKRAWVLLVPIVFFFAPRSLSTYLVDLVPLAVMAAVSVHSAPTRNDLATRRAVAIFAVPVAGVIVCCTLAFSSQTLRIGVDAAQLTGTDPSVTITATNLTSAVQRPHFMVDPGGGATGYWMPGDGAPVVLAPHAHATLTLHPPAPIIAPQRGARWLVEAYTTSPAVLSTSPLVRWPLH